MNGDQVAVIFDITGKAQKEDRILDPALRPSIYWISGTYSSLEGWDCMVEYELTSFIVFHINVKVLVSCMLHGRTIRSSFKVGWPQHCDCDLG